MVYLGIHLQFQHLKLMPCQGNLSSVLVVSSNDKFIKDFASNIQLNFTLHAICSMNALRIVLFVILEPMCFLNARVSSALVATSFFCFTSKS